MEDSTSAISWFYRVLRNALTDYYRRRDSRGRAIDRLAAETESATEPDKELETALRRVELEGASVRSFAEETGITPGNAGVRLHRAREALRKQLVRCCGACLEHGCFDCACRK